MLPQNVHAANEETLVLELSQLQVNRPQTTAVPSGACCPVWYRLLKELLLHQVRKLTLEELTISWCTQLCVFYFLIKNKINCIAAFSMFLFVTEQLFKFFFVCGGQLLTTFFLSNVCTFVKIA